MPPRQWEPLVEDFSQVMKKVHLMFRRDQVDIESIYAEVFREKRNAYEDGLAVQAANVGCAGRRGITPPNVMKEMSEQAHREAAGISNTYNYDLAIAVRAIRIEVPKANRWTYAKRLGAWEATRDEWKSKQISLWNQMQWQDRATSDFLVHNQMITKGWARVMPSTRAVCKICQYWVKRGKVPLTEMSRQKWPAHLNCPHYWETHYAGRVKCDELWMGAPVVAWWEEIRKELGKKGGTGSGNWGHAGRPGLVGGSGGGAGMVGKQVDVTIAGVGVRGKIIGTNSTSVLVEYEEGKVAWVPQNELSSEHPVGSTKSPAVNIGYHGTSGDVARRIMRQGLRTFSDEELGRAPSVYYTESKDMALRYGRGSLLGPGSMYAIIEFEIPKGATPIPDEIGSTEDYRIERGIPSSAIASIQVFDVNDNVVEELKGAKVITGYAVVLIDDQSEKKELGKKGGSGSGNWGHTGRPGLVSSNKKERG